MIEFQKVKLFKSFKWTAFERKFAVMLMLEFDRNFQKKKNNIKESAKIESYSFFLSYKESTLNHWQFKSKLLNLLKCLLQSS